VPGARERALHRLTESQEETIRKIAPRKFGGDASVATMLNVRGLADVSDLTKSDASKLLDVLFKAEWLPRNQPVAGAGHEVTEGMYRTPDGSTYKVQKSQQGNLYAKKLTASGFEYETGAIRKLEKDHRMTLAQAKEYGALYGTCCVCGRTLTDEGSISAGIGPVCAAKTNWR